MKLLKSYQKFISFIALFAIVFFISCSKEEDQPADNGGIKIISLIATDTVLVAWIDTTNINVVATGDNLAYEWSCNHGTLRGSGTSVKYTAGECCVGVNTITCRVFNDSSSTSKDIDIRITSYFDQ